MENRLHPNTHDLERELTWFAQVVDARFKLYFDQEPEYSDVVEVAPPDHGDSESPWACFVRQHRLTFFERLAVVLALMPHIRPQLLDIFFIKNAKFDRPFTEFGGVRRGGLDFWPTGETLTFLLAANDLETRFAVQKIFDPCHLFARQNVLRLDPTGDQPGMKGPLVISEEHLSLFTIGEPTRPDFGTGFPARYIETALEWDDLVLHPGTLQQIREIEIWLSHGDTLMHEWGMAAKLRPGYRGLFYGPPGTGKTMTACLLGKSTGRDVYRVDLSLVISKYIGETEKNLARVFDQAQNRSWILFFDEADAIFGKRSETKNAHDRYANQEVSFLLQRIETFDGIAILASNQRQNLDDAFTRRFESVIYFPMPRSEERLLLWQKGFSDQAELEPALDLEAIAREHELSGGSIMNVIRYASLMALEAGTKIITSDAVLTGVHRELVKEGKMV